MLSATVAKVALSGRGSGWTFWMFARSVLCTDGAGDGDLVLGAGDLERFLGDWERRRAGCVRRLFGLCGGEALR